MSIGSLDIAPSRSFYIFFFTPTTQTIHSSLLECFKWVLSSSHFIFGHIQFATLMLPAVLYYCLAEQLFSCPTYFVFGLNVYRGKVPKDYFCISLHRCIIVHFFMQLWAFLQTLRRQHMWVRFHG